MDISKELDDAWQGFYIWKALNEKFVLGDSERIICFSTENHSMNLSAINQLDNYAKHRYLKRFILLFIEGCDVDDKLVRVNTEYETVYYTESKMANLISFFRLVNASDKVIVISDKEPFGNLNLVGKHGINLDEYIAGTYLGWVNASNG